MVFCGDMGTVKRPRIVTLFRIACCRRGTVDVVWVLLADSGFTQDLKTGIELLSEDEDPFLGHILLMDSAPFFGPCFGKLGILNQNRKSEGQK